MQRITQRSGHGPLPLSFAQQRLWILDQLEPNSPLYNMPVAVRLEGPLNPDALRHALNQIVLRHESLRTTFPAEQGQPRQAIFPTLDIHLPVTDLSRLPIAEREAEALKIAGAEGRSVFDLARGPLLRARLIRLHEDTYVLALSMHHIVSDGWSIGVFMRELKTFYTAFINGKESPLPELPVQYGDYAEWQRNWLQGEVFERHLSYWKAKLAGAPPLLNLPVDRPRNQAGPGPGATIDVSIDGAIVEKLGALARRDEMTLFMVLLAVFNVLLFRHSNQADILVVNGIEYQTYPTEMENFYAASAVFGSHQVDVWDLFGDQGFVYETNPSISQVVELQSRVPTSVLELYDTVIWVGNNYSGDLDYYDAAQVLDYVGGGGNFILATRLGSSFLTTALRQYCGITAVSGDLTVSQLEALDENLVNMATIGTNSLVHLVTLGATSEAIPIFRYPAAPTMAAGFRLHKEGDGAFIYVAGRPYRYDAVASYQNYEYMLDYWTGPVTAVDDDPGVVPLAFGLAQNISTTGAALAATVIRKVAWGLLFPA